MHDLVVRGGTVVDGVGGEPITADVAVSDGRITEVGEVDGPARQTIDADGLLVTPGLRRPAHPLRRPGHLGLAARAVELARGHHGRRRATAVSASHRCIPAASASSSS